MQVDIFGDFGDVVHPQRKRELEKSAFRTRSIVEMFSAQQKKPKIHIWGEKTKIQLTN